MKKKVKSSDESIVNTVGLTKKERMILEKAVLSVHRSIRARHSSGGTIEKTMAGLSLQDWLNGVSCDGIQPWNLKLPI